MFSSILISMVRFESIRIHKNRHGIFCFSYEFMGLRIPRNGIDATGFSPVASIPSFFSVTPRQNRCRLIYASMTPSNRGRTLLLNNISNKKAPKETKVRIVLIIDIPPRILATVICPHLYMQHTPFLAPGQDFCILSQTEIFFNMFFICIDCAESPLICFS